VAKSRQIRGAVRGLAERLLQPSPPQSGIVFFLHAWGQQADRSRAFYPAPKTVEKHRQQVMDKSCRQDLRPQRRVRRHPPGTQHGQRTEKPAIQRAAAVAAEIGVYGCRWRRTPCCRDCRLRRRWLEAWLGLVRRHRRGIKCAHGRSRRGDAIGRVANGCPAVAELMVIIAEWL